MPVSASEHSTRRVQTTGFYFESSSLFRVGVVVHGMACPPESSQGSGRPCTAGILVGGAAAAAVQPAAGACTALRPMLAAAQGPISTFDDCQRCLKARRGEMEVKPQVPRRLHTRFGRHGGIRGCAVAGVSDLTLRPHQRKIVVLAKTTCAGCATRRQVSGCSAIFGPSFARPTFASQRALSGCSSKVLLSKCLSGTP